MQQHIHSKAYIIHMYSLEGLWWMLFLPLLHFCLFSWIILNPLEAGVKQFHVRLRHPTWGYGFGEAELDQSCLPSLFFLPPHCLPPPQNASLPTPIYTTWRLHGAPGCVWAAFLSRKVMVRTGRACEWWKSNLNRDNISIQKFPSGCYEGCSLFLAISKARAWCPVLAGCCLIPGITGVLSPSVLT